MKMKLYSYYMSSCPHRVRIVHRFKGLGYEYIPVDLWKREQFSPEFWILVLALGQLSGRGSSPYLRKTFEIEDNAGIKHVVLGTDNFRALREVWPNPLEKVDLVEPSQPYATCRSKPRTKHEECALSKDISKAERERDLVIASYVLGEIPSLRDRITTIHQLCDLKGDVLVLVEPGTPNGVKIISQMRSLILWMEKRRSEGVPVRDFEDEKFLYVAFRRGQGPRWS